MNSEQARPDLMSEVLIMPDGKIFAHNLTPAMAAVLSELNPSDEGIKQRAIIHVDQKTKSLLPAGWDNVQSKS